MKEKTFITNPTTQRPVALGSRTYKKLVKDGYIDEVVVPKKKTPIKKTLRVYESSDEDETFKWMNQNPYSEEEQEQETPDYPESEEESDVDEEALKEAYKLLRQNKNNRKK